MFDLDAPIIPGESAAGIQLGSPISLILTNEKPKQIVSLDSCKRYEFDSISVWETNGKILQIGLHAGYRGTLENRIRIGSTIRAIQEQFGDFAEDEEDNLVIEGNPGWCFETETWSEARHQKPDPKLKVTDIFVFDINAK